MDAAQLQSLIEERLRPAGPDPGWTSELSNLLRGEVRRDEPLKRHTSIQIGGPADAYVLPADLEDLQKLLLFAEEKHVPWLVLGLGSNVLIKDGGIRGIVLRLHKLLNQFQVLEENETETIVEAQAGVPLPRLVEFSRQKSLEGIESLYGIPASVGGALWMNAGTRQGEIKDSVIELTMMKADGSLLSIPREKLKFEYRHLKLPGRGIILSGKFRLKKGEAEQVESRIREYQKKRQDSQPLDSPSVGSVFKNPPKGFAAQMIEELGLKGVRVGGARISPKHANFIINEDGATAREVLILIGLIRDKVQEELGIRLELEVKVLGEE